MDIFTYMNDSDYEQLVLCQDANSSLKAIIAIHDTTLGPALGGARMWTYETENEAIEDALRLAKGMTYKNAAACLNLGGGKAVIIGNPQKDKSEELFRSFGRYVQSLNGRYITAEDVGTTEQDMDIIYQETNFVTGTSVAPGSSGDPSPVTAYGIYLGIKASTKVSFGNDSLEGKKIAVQGVGQVAFTLCDYLPKEGAQLIVTDINKEAVKRAVDRFNAKVVDPNDIYDVDCDIFSPCALGAIINDDTISRLKAKVVAGSANNQLKSNEHGEKLYEKGIIYAPDYVINAGGVINIADELNGSYNQQRAMNKVATIYNNLLKIFDISAKDNIPTHLAADRLAEQRISKVRNSRNRFLLDEKHVLKNK